MRRFTLISLTLLLGAGTASAGGAYLQGAAAQGFVHPAMLVGFNPQPEPPGHVARMDLRDATAPSVALTQRAGRYAELLLAAGARGGVRSIVAPAKICGGERDVVLFPARGEVRIPERCVRGPLVLAVRLADGATLHLTLRVEAEGGYVSPAAMVGFNPQPEPPGMPAAVALGVTFDGEVADLALTITAEIDGEPVAWQ